MKKLEVIDIFLKSFLLTFTTSSTFQRRHQVHCNYLNMESCAAIVNDLFLQRPPAQMLVRVLAMLLHSLSVLLQAMTKYFDYYEPISCQCSFTIPTENRETFGFLFSACAERKHWSEMVKELSLGGYFLKKAFHRGAIFSGK